MGKSEHYVITTFRLSPFILKWNVIGLAGSFIYALFGSGQISFLMLFISNLIFAVAPLLKWYNIKLILTNRKIIYYTGSDKPIADWSLFRDISYIEYKYAWFLGEYFNYGSIEVVNQENKTFKINMLKNPKILYDNTIELIDSYWIDKNPDYKPLGKRGKPVNINSTDRLES